MFFNNREYGKLFRKENVNGSIVYTVENSKGKRQSISFDSDVCPTVNVGDEVFFIYNRNAFSDIKKGMFLSGNLKETIIFNNQFIFPDNILFCREFFGFAITSAISMTISTFSFAYGIVFILHALGIYQLGDLGIWGLKAGLFLSVSIPGIFILTNFLKNVEIFSKLSQRRDAHFFPYKKENFTRKDIILNRTLKEEEKTKLTMFVRDIEDLSSTEKLEIYEYIDEQKKMKVNQIGYLDILNVSNKLKMKKRIEQFLLK